MKLSEQVKPISYLKAHAPEIIRGLAEGSDPVIITLHGKAAAVLQDIGSYEQTQETLALLKVLALSARDEAEGRLQSLDDAFAEIRGSISARGR